MTNEYQIARQETLDNQRSNAEAYDRALLTLSSAFLALSVSFLRDEFKDYVISWPILLFCSWLLFALTIVATIFGYIYAQRTTDYKLATLQEFFQEPINLDTRERINNEISRRGKVERRTNEFSGVVFVLAVILTIVFVIVNASGELTMTQQNGNQDHDIGRSSPSAPFPSRPTVPAPQPITTPAPKPSAPTSPIQPAPQPPKKT
ncbi:MAG TPA: hypothetical protein VGT99_05725 [Gammaproteobacteria bacterium]|nr:hypothetical protein [Gammaproteobacteria bacterium]